MKYKFIFVILSSSNLPIQNVYYNSNDKYEKFKQLQKMYLHLYPNDIKFFFIEYIENLFNNKGKFERKLLVETNVEPKPLTLSLLPQ